MRKSVCILLFLFACNLVLAQEEIIPLSTNPVLQQKNELRKNNASGQRASGRSVFFEIDTLSLPVMDDFSADFFCSYDSAHYDASAKQDKQAYNFTFNNAPINSVSCLFNKAKQFSYNPDTHLTDSVENNTPYGTIQLYQNTYNPFLPTSDFNVYPTYTRTYYDTLGGIKFSYDVPPDTTFNLIIDTIRVVKMISKKAIWLDNNVYRNNNLGVNAPSVFVATFDGVDSTGYPYDFANYNAQGLADILTSKPIDLKTGLQANDSTVYLSFYYQPQGLGAGSLNAPEEEDSLSLEIKSPYNNYWNWVWSSTGRELSTGEGFKQIMIHISDTIFLQKGFQFRFKNYATLSGNFDHWNVDYIRLNKNRSAVDTFSNDRGIAQIPNSFLNYYTVMPYKYFKGNETTYLLDEVDVTLKNFNNQAEFTNFLKMEIIHNGTQAYVKDIGLVDFNSAYESKTYSCPHENYLFEGSGNPNWLDFKVQFDFKSNTTPNIDFPYNDTISFNQAFRNYFARDDGSAEAGYGINAEGAKFAVKFHVPSKDTLRGISMNFIPQIYNQSTSPFKLKVWADSIGFPGKEIYESSDYFYPQYNGYNSFAIYLLTDLVEVQDSFYIGWVQVTDAKLNLGLDLNSNYSQFTYYNSDDTWHKSIYPGTPLIRPWLGTDTDVKVKVVTKDNSSFVVFPNPAQNSIIIKRSNDYYKTETLSIYDISGKQLLSCPVSTNSIDISNLSNGIYFVSLDNQTQKLIIAR